MGNWAEKHPISGFRQFASQVETPHLRVKNILPVGQDPSPGSAIDMLNIVATKYTAVN